MLHGLLPPARGGEGQNNPVIPYSGPDPQILSRIVMTTLHTAIKAITLLQVTFLSINVVGIIPGTCILYSVANQHFIIDAFYNSYITPT